MMLVEVSQELLVALSWAEAVEGCALGLSQLCTLRLEVTRVGLPHDIQVVVECLTFNRGQPNDFLIWSQHSLGS